MLAIGKVYANLPSVFTPLVGRDLEIKAASTLLLREDVRALTLTGTGGIGKTRLAIQIATELSPAFTEGVCFVSLAPISDPAQVMPAIARALELREDLDSSSQEQIQNYVRDQRLLLLLDNFEQVIAAAPMLNDLLAACSALRLLVTSRVRLHIPNEQVFRIHPLALPDLARLPSSDALARVASVDLFLQRARQVQPGFKLTRVNARTVAEICSRLDGLPLAVELAAARVNLLPPQALLKRLENRLSVLTSSAESHPSRHQTLRTTIQWSYDLLNVDEQQLFRALSLFVDGFTLHAAEALCTHLHGSGSGVLDRLSSLLEKNLLRAPEQDEEDPRLSMLETIRAFGLEILATSGELETIQNAHMQYFLTVAEEASAPTSGQSGAEQNRYLERESANLRAALQYSLAYGKQAATMNVALRLGTALGGFWAAYGYLREGKAFLEETLAECEGTIDAIQVKALLASARFALLFCEYNQAQHMLERCRAYHQAQDDTAQLAVVVWQLGWLAHLQYSYAQAHALYEEALALSEKVHDEKMKDAVRYHQAYLALSEGDYQQSRVLFEASLAYRRAIGTSFGIAAALGDLAQLLRLSSVTPPVEEMQRLLDESMIHARITGDRGLFMALQYGVAWVAFLRGNLDEADRMVNEVIAFYKEAGKLQSLGHYLELLARIYAAQGKRAEARATFEESVVQTLKQKDIDTMSAVLVELAHLAVEQQQYARAARLLGADEKIREAASLTIDPFDSPHHNHAMTIANAVLGRDNFELLWQEGRSLSPIEALATGDSLPSNRKSALNKNITYPSGLTRREIDVLCLVAQGFTDAQVGEQLVISKRTVTTHLTSIYNKLQISSRAAATNFAVKNHLV
jgi:predicted ATPase/DNA-binding CsgD family transcriptional regulator